MKFVVSFCVIFTGLISSGYCASFVTIEGDACSNTDGPGICKKKSDCEKAEADVDKYGYHNFTRCGFYKLTEIVCCPPDKASRLNKPERRKSQTVCDQYTQKFSNIVFPQIAHGKDANPGEFPHMAALGIFSKTEGIYRFDCGGTLISEKYVISAAHCFANIAQDPVKIVRLGELRVPATISKINPNIDYNIKTFTLHPNYHRRRQTNDIALIELEKPVQLRDDLRPACLFTNETAHPQELTITGWGQIDQNGARKDILQKATVTLVPLTECQERYRKHNRSLQNNQLCAVDSRSDTCQGDSGGPLHMKNSDVAILVGVTSYGAPICNGSIPSVYTSIPQHLDWIENIVWP